MRGDNISKHTKNEDLIGKEFGHLTIIGFRYKETKNGKKKRICICKCKCGNTCEKWLSHLKRDKNASCGCMANYYRSINNRSPDRIGEKFGRLTILSVDYSQPMAKVNCLCDCGNYITANKADVIKGHTQSCGCLQKERTSKANQVDNYGYVSDYGVTIKERHHFDRTWYHNCICPVCGKTFVEIPARIKDNHVTSCGCSRESKRERFVAKVLDELGLKYVQQIRFDECKNHYTLPFDFGVYGRDGKLRLIECDG